MSTDRGTVLISVLWIILVLSFVSFSLASSVRVEVNANQHSFDSERAFFMAKGAAEIVFNAYSKELPVPKNSPIRQEKGEYVFPFESGEARVRLESKAGLINLNSASDKTLASLFDSLGVDRETRNRLVDSILDWRDNDDIPHLYGAEVGDYENQEGQPSRPRNGSFSAVDELLLVRNVTPEIFFGSIVVDSLSGTYRRIPGVRELVAVRPGPDAVDPNLASFSVLRALPEMNDEMAGLVISERDRQPFSNLKDLVDRIPELNQTVAYLSLESSRATELVSRATITASGVSRTVRLLFKLEEKNQVLRFSPYLFRTTTVMLVDRWRLE